MRTSNKYNSSSADKTNKWIKIIGIPALIISAYCLGLYVLGPWFKSYSGPRSQIAQSPVPSSLRTQISSNKKEPKLDLQITENKATPSAQTNNADYNGVKKNGKDLTITLEPGTGAQQADQQNPDSDANNQTPMEPSQPAQVEQPKRAPQSSTIDAGTVERSRAAVSSAARKGLYRVQSGTYSNKASADRLAQDLSEHGYKAQVTSAQMEDRTLYRVTVGEYKSRSAEDEVVHRMKSDGYNSTVIAVK
jgi:cell division protein FtsN